MTELRLETYTMPAADLGSENPLPQIVSEHDLHANFEAPEYIPDDMRRNFDYGQVPNIMPYTMQDGYGRETKPRDFRVAVLENDILRATFLLELGGRLWSIIHKPSGRELLAVNPTFQPANLAFRNAWFSGGVEWNIGTIGHTPFTCAPLFAARVESPDGMPILRLYEWERIRQTPFQIDNWLPDNSPVLFVRVRITNPHDQTVPMYWWSNIAVPETPDTRVLVPAETTYRFNYSGLDIKPVPEIDGLDITYATNIPHSADYFFHVDDNRYPWITALDGAGKGLVQTSTRQLKGRKLFVWGMGSGGQHWQKFLSPKGDPYIEIQAGLARSQLEHRPMPPGEWSWLEAYGLMVADPNKVHGEDWQQAQQAVEESLERLISKADLEEEFKRGAIIADTLPSEILQRGSGWGRLEELRREAASEKPFCTPAIIFDNESLTAAQQPWLSLLQEEYFPASSPEEPIMGFLVQKEWRNLLEKSLGNNRNDTKNWLAWYHLGVMRYCDRDLSDAAAAWEKSLTLAETPWTLRNLAVLATELGQIKKAGDLYLKASRQSPELLPLIVESCQFLLKNNRATEVKDLLTILSDTIKENGRMRFLQTLTALEIGNLPIVKQYLAAPPTVVDIREGETTLSDLWYEYHARRLNQEDGIAIDDALRARIRREFPVPEALDFRMKIGDEQK